MGPLLVSFAVGAAERLARHDIARENARVAATALARDRVDRLEVEHFLEQHGRDAVRTPRVGHAR